MTLRRNIFSYIMVAPALLLVLALGVYPMLGSLRLAMVQYDLMRLDTEGSPFVGFANFRTIFDDPRFLGAFINTILFAVISVGSVTLLGLLIAQVLNMNIRGRGALRSLVLVPWVIPPVVASAIWMWVFQPERSPINQVLKALGLIDSNIKFLTDATHTLGPLSIPMLSVSAVRIWGGLPFVTVMILAGLQSIPHSVIEAATIDGASPWKRFWTIVFPLLSPTTFFLLVINIIYAFFDTFAVVDATTHGGPGKETAILVYKVYYDGFKALDMGGSAAQSVILMLIVIALTVVQFRFVEKKVQY